MNNASDGDERGEKYGEESQAILANGNEFELDLTHVLDVYRICPA